MVGGFALPEGGSDGGAGVGLDGAGVEPVVVCDESSEVGAASVPELPDVWLVAGVVGVMAGDAGEASAKAGARGARLKARMTRTDTTWNLL